MNHCWRKFEIDLEGMLLFFSRVDQCCQKLFLKKTRCIPKLRKNEHFTPNYQKNGLFGQKNEKKEIPELKKSDFILSNEFWQYWSWCMRKSNVLGTSKNFWIQFQQWFISLCELNIFFQLIEIAFQWFEFQSKTSFYTKAKSFTSSNSYTKNISTIPYNSYRRNIRGSIALALDPQLIFIQTLIPKLKWIPSSMGRKSMVACTSMEVFAWVTLGGLIAQPICTMLHLLLEKCNYPKISKSFIFL